PSLPVSIHDLDTTPREPQSARPTQPSTGPAPEQRKAFSSSNAPPYEVIDAASNDKPKGGWWRKLTGQ
ncbi:MAG: hypothetical protein M3N08_07745, partial [Pseudomonadota bacterium]|nr:hypothetical protein [Pseudomonadota bacterium]